MQAKPALHNLSDLLRCVASGLLALATCRKRYIVRRIYLGESASLSRLHWLQYGFEQPLFPTYSVNVFELKCLNLLLHISTQIIFTCPPKFGKKILLELWSLSFDY